MQTEKLKNNIEGFTMKRRVTNFGYIGNLLAEAKVIVDCLGGGNDALFLILETASVESKLGGVNDRSLHVGMGICQFDRFPFYDHKRRSMRFRKKIVEELGVDIKLIEWEDLRYNSFLSLLFCRLFYLNIQKPIPSSVEDRAGYWKKYYNTFLGKGTIEHYLIASTLVDELIGEVEVNE